MGMLVQDDIRAIPKDVALRLCEEIRNENKGKLIGFGAMQCWGCLHFSNGDLEKMCISGKPGNRGCNLINTRYDRMVPPAD